MIGKIAGRTNIHPNQQDNLIHITSNIILPLLEKGTSWEEAIFGLDILEGNNTSIKEALKQQIQENFPRLNLTRSTVHPTVDDAVDAALAAAMQVDDAVRNGIKATFATLSNEDIMQRILQTAYSINTRGDTQERSLRKFAAAMKRQTLRQKSEWIQEKKAWKALRDKDLSN